MNQHRHGQTGGGGVRRLGGGPPSHGGSGPIHQHAETVAHHWPGYLDGGYFDEQGNLKVEYVSRDRVEPLARNMAEASPKLTTHQVRRFFSHARRIERQLRLDPDVWPRLLSDVKFLDEAAADASGKKEKKIPDLFHDFIKRNVAAIKTPQDFLNGFLRHFEALVAFGSLHFRER